ncbi:MAG: hypothetical protein RXR43_16005 [Sulfolobus sp.]
MVIRKMIEEKNLKFNLKAELYEVYQTQNGVVAVYKLYKPLEESKEEDYFLPYFYLATYDNGVSETPFGVGPTPWAALEYAAAVWDLPQDNKTNPFKEVLSSSQPS